MTAQSTAPILAATGRTLIGKQSRQLRTQGLVPAVVYGHGEDSVALTISEREFSRLYRTVSGSTLVDLQIDGKAGHKVLIQDVQFHAPTGNVMHVDFYQVNLKEKLRTNISLNYVGVSEAVEVLGGTLITVRDEVEVECLPQDLVQAIDIDITILKNFDDVIRVSDITIPAGIVILDDVDEMVASITAPRTEEELESLNEAVVDAAATVESETTSGTDTTPEVVPEKK